MWLDDDYVKNFPDDFICPECGKDDFICNCEIEAHPIEADRSNWVDIAQSLGERIG